MRNEEKHALRRELRGRRSQMGWDVRAAATVKINRLLKRYIKHGRKIGVYWPMGKELRLDGFVRAAQKRGAKLYLPYIEPRSRRMWFTPYPESGMERERIRGRARLNVPQFAGRKIRVHGLSVLLVPLVGIDREVLPFGAGRRLLRCDACSDEIPFAGKNRGRGLCLPVGGQTVGRGARPAAGRFCVGGGDIVFLAVQTAF